VAIVAGSVSTMTLVLALLGRWRRALVLLVRLLAGHRRTMLVMLPVMPFVMS
jgi:hypothetical protein